MTSEHLTNEQFQMLIDDEVPVGDVRELRAHLRSCNRCTSTYNGWMGFDRMFSAMADESVNSDFTRNVLVKLNILPKESALFRVVENLGYVFGLMIVLGVMLSVFIITGVVRKDQLLQTKSVIGETVSQLTSQMDSGFGTLAAALQKYLPFVFGNESLKIVVMGAVIVGMLALVDRVMRGRVVR